MNKNVDGRATKETGELIGIAISVYDRFEELALLVDIIRKNWKHKYVISVCSNFPGAREYLEKLDIDTYTISTDIKYERSMGLLRTRVSMACRVFDSIKKTCAGADNLGCDYVIHLHTDAWTLKEEGVRNLARTLKKTGKVLAIRGMGFTKYRSDCPLGHVDDMFMMYNAAYAKRVGLFDVNPLTMLPTRLSMHGILSTLFLGKVGLDKIFLYDRLTENVYWDGWPHKIGYRGMLPTAFDPKRGFLHVHRGGLPGEFCQNIQAMYLQDYGLTKGEHIEPFLQKYTVDKQKLMKDIREVELKVNRKLRWSGFPVLEWGRFGRDISRKNWYFGLSLRKKIKYWGITMFANFWDSVIKKRFGIEILPNYNLWPESLSSYMTKELDVNDFPKEMIWFEQKIDPEAKKSVSQTRYNLFWMK
jgi:hypothetical protein